MIEPDRDAASIRETTTEDGWIRYWRNRYIGTSSISTAGIVAQKLRIGCRRLMAAGGGGKIIKLPRH